MVVDTDGAASHACAHATHANANARTEDAGAVPYSNSKHTQINKRQIQTAHTQNLIQKLRLQPPASLLCLVCCLLLSFVPTFVFYSSSPASCDSGIVLFCFACSSSPSYPTFISMSMSINKHRRQRTTTFLQVARTRTKIELNASESRVLYAPAAATFRC